VEITARSRNGGKNSRKNARAKIGPIYWANYNIRTCVIPSASEGPPFALFVTQAVTC